MEEGRKYTLTNLGWNDFFAASRRRLGPDGFLVARVTAEHKGAYDVINEQGEFLAKITGKQMFKAHWREDYPAVGDWVVITVADGNRAVINSVLPRKTVIKRKSGDRNRAGGKTEVQVIGANIDVAFVVESIGRDYSLNRLERYFALAKNAGVEPQVVLNKTDLISKEELEVKMLEIKNRFNGLDAVPTSTVNEQGLDELKKRILPGLTYCFLGSSGVGKSSLINKLLGINLIKTGKISSSSGRGMHVTTGREMYFLQTGGIVIDNPGIREVGLAEAGAGLDNVFDEITALAASCKFSDCSHTREPGCAVLAALQTGVLDKNKYNNYINLKKEAGFYKMTDFEKKKKSRNFGKFMKKAKQDLKHYGHKDY